MLRWSYLEHRVIPEVASRLLIQCVCTCWDLGTYCTNYVTSDLVPVSTHVREHVYDQRYINGYNPYFSIVTVNKPIDKHYSPVSAYDNHHQNKRSSHQASIHSNGSSNVWGCWTWFQFLLFTYPVISSKSQLILRNAMTINQGAAPWIYYMSIS